MIEHIVYMLTTGKTSEGSKALMHIHHRDVSIGGYLISIQIILSLVPMDLNANMHMDSVKLITTLCCLERLCVPREGNARRLIYAIIHIIRIS